MAIESAAVTFIESNKAINPFMADGNASMSEDIGNLLRTPVNLE
jgi:hypothetical protein